MARAASSAVSTRRLRRRFAHARELGANFLRLAHYPHHERAAEIADEEGMLLWEELPVYWSLAFDNAGNLQDARNQLSELVLRDRNRASVILWGLANETADTESRTTFTESLVATVRSLDPSRPTAAACLFQSGNADCRGQPRVSGRCCWNQRAFQLERCRHG